MEISYYSHVLIKLKNVLHVFDWNLLSCGWRSMDFTGPLTSPEIDYPHC